MWLLYLYLCSFSWSIFVFLDAKITTKEGLENSILWQDGILAHSLILQSPFWSKVSNVGTGWSKHLGQIVIEVGIMFTLKNEGPEIAQFLVMALLDCENLSLFCLVSLAEMMITRYCSP